MFSGWHYVNGGMGGGQLGGSAQDSLFVRLHTLVQFDDVAADKPDQVAEIGDGRFVPDIVQHVLVVHCEDKGSASGSGLGLAPRPPERWKHTLRHKPWAPRGYIRRGELKKKKRERDTLNKLGGKLRRQTSHSKSKQMNVHNKSLVLSM